MGSRRRWRGELASPQVLAEHVVTRIVNQRAAGGTLQSIADGLMVDAVPTARGGVSWRPSSVAAVLQSPAAAAGAQVVR